MTWLQQLSGVSLEWDLEEIEHPGHVSSNALSRDFSVLQITLNWFRGDDAGLWWSMTNETSFLLEALRRLRECKKIRAMLKAGEGEICADTPSSKHGRTRLSDAVVTTILRRSRQQRISEFKYEFASNIFVMYGRLMKPTDGEERSGTNTSDLPNVESETVIAEAMAMESNRSDIEGRPIPFPPDTPLLGIPQEQTEGNTVASRIVPEGRLDDRVQIHQCLSSTASASPTAAPAAANFEQEPPPAAPQGGGRDNAPEEEPTS